MTLENLRLEELMRRKEAELRAILEGVADGIAAEDPDGQLVFVNAAAARLLNGADSLGAALGIAPTLLPGRHVFEGEQPEPLVVKHAHRWSRVKASPVLEGSGPRLAISVVEDITEIKQAEEAQRFLSDVSRVLAGSLQLDRTLPEVARLAAAHFGGTCVIELDERPATGAGTGDPTLTLPLHDGALHLGGRVDHATAGELALRIGAAVENARLYRQREAIAHTLQQSLLPRELPEIPGLDSAALYRPAGEINEVGGDFYDLFPIGARRVVRGHRRRLRQGRRGRRGDRARPLHDPRRGHPPPLTGQRPALAQRGDAAPARRALRDARVRAHRARGRGDRRPSPAAATRRRACCAPPGSSRRSARSGTIVGVLAEDRGRPTRPRGSPPATRSCSTPTA